MRAHLSTFQVLLFASATSLATVAACAADGDAPDLETTADPPVSTEVGAKLPSPSNPAAGGDGGSAGGLLDSGASGETPAPPSAKPGEPCAKIDEIYTRACGACGKQTALCFSEDGGAPVVSEYSACAGEVPGGCLAGTVEDVPCGNCGTQKKTCDSTCKWFTAACVQPPGACKEGAVEYTVTGCPTTNTYRHRSCALGCAWSSYSACAAPANDVVVDVNPTVSLLSTTSVTLSVAQLDAGIPTGGTCPAATLLAGDFPYAYIEVRNTTGKQARVLVSTSTPAGGRYLNVSLVGYKVPFVPSGEDARKACSNGPSASLPNLILEPGTSMLVYVRSWSAHNPSNPAQSTGLINVNVRTDALL
jgi:hypothetical protein